MIDWVGLENRFPDRPGYAAMVIASILRTDTGTPARLRAAVAAGDFPAITALAHGIYNTALLAMAAGLAGQAKETETAARAQRREAMAYAAKLSSAFECMLACLAQRQAPSCPQPQPLVTE